MTLLAVAVLFSAKHIVLLLYGEEYLPVTYAMNSILWGITVTTLYKVIFAHFAAHNRLGITILAASFSLVVNLAMNIYMIPRYGIVGAGISTSFSQSVLTGILILFFRRYEKIGLREILIPTGEDFESYRRAIRKGLQRVRRIRRER